MRRERNTGRNEGRDKESGRIDLATWPQFEELPREDDSAQGSQGTERSRLTKDEIMLLREFIAQLDEWDRKSKTT
jgi:hypothetical protein